MTQEKSNIETKLTYLIIGGGIGAILALLFAPKAGEKLRADIADATRKGMNKTEELATQLGETAQSVYSDTKNKAGEIYDSAKQKLHSAETTITEIQGNLQNGIDHKVEQISASIVAGRKEYDREDSFQGDKSKGKGN